MGGRTLAAGLALFGIFQLPQDIAEVPQSAEPWRLALSYINRETGLWLFASVLLLWLSWTDVRPRLRAYRIRQRASMPEDQDDIAAKMRLHEGYADYIAPAFGALISAAEKSVQVVAHAWASHPANFIIHYAYSDAFTHDTVYRRILDNAETLSQYRLPQVEDILLKVLHQYAIILHILHETVSRLIANDKTVHSLGFDEDLSAWIEMHGSMMRELRKLKQVHELKALRAYSFATYLEDGRFPLSTFVEALDRPRS